VDHTAAVEQHVAAAVVDHTAAVEQHAAAAVEEDANA
jgi:hypothetical protein